MPRAAEGGHSKRALTQCRIDSREVHGNHLGCPAIFAVAATDIFVFDASPNDRRTFEVQIQRSLNKVEIDLDVGDRQRQFVDPPVGDGHRDRCGDDWRARIDGLTPVDDLAREAGFVGCAIGVNLAWNPGIRADTLGVDQIERHIDRFRRVVRAVFERRLAGMKMTHPVVDPFALTAHRELTHVSVILVLMSWRCRMPSPVILVYGMSCRDFVTSRVDGVSDGRLNTDPVGLSWNGMEVAHRIDFARIGKIVYQTTEVGRVTENAVIVPPSLAGRFDGDQGIGNDPLGDEPVGATHLRLTSRNRIDNDEIQCIGAGSRQSCIIVSANSNFVAGAKSRQEIIRV